ncbi:MAG: DUF971 domain-containing protein [Blastocatellia bacterium]|nr:DUF971 domain-containing protein [Blastocatellia bacterium]
MDVFPTEVSKTAPAEVTIKWNDNHTTIFQTFFLRCECTCAGCVNEFTGERILDVSKVAKDVTINNAQHVGNYGVQFFFSDRHSNGIYTWERLRQLCPCPTCSSGQRQS